MIAPNKRQRSQLQKDDVADDERLRRVLNDFMLDVQQRLEAVEASPGFEKIELDFETGAVVGPAQPPFSTSTGLKVSIPYTPAGVVVLSLQQVQPAGQPVLSSAVDVKWHYGAGAGPGDGVLHIDYVTGLSANCRYSMRLGVTRG